MKDVTYTGTGDQVTTYFTGKAAQYDRYRPAYPAAAIATILESLGPEPIVADVGCGTGIASRLLAGAGARVIGIEPNQEMRRRAAELGSPAPQEIEYRDGTGEETGLGSDAVDAVVCAQSFHWFDAEPALREFHRVIRPGGRLALMWNVRDDSDPGSVEYEQIIQTAQRHADESGRVLRRNRSADPLVGGFFRNVRKLAFANPVQYDLDSLLGRARSASYWPESGDLRENLEETVIDLFHRRSIDGTFTLHQTCELTLADRATFRPRSVEA